MICLLSYVGMNLQSEVCLWTLLGILRTILEATSLFKVNDKLKQVWQMSMPAEMSMPVQRAFRTMICGVLLVQCFTVYVYLASYVVLLYPVVLEERPTLVLLWLLLAAIRNFLCELTSLALGLGACILLGPSKPSCLKFVIGKVASIAPAFYMWMLVYTYYKSLKLAVAFKTFPAAVQGSNHDYGLELAVRRRLTKSLQKEDQLRRNLTAIFQDEPKHLIPIKPNSMERTKSVQSIYENEANSNTNGEASHDEMDTTERLISNLGVYEDWCGDEITVPRDTDRILEQFVLMMLRIGAFMKSGKKNPRSLFSTISPTRLPLGSLDCSAVNNDDADPPPSVGSCKPRTTSYIQEYPQIFMKRTSDSFQRIPEQIINGNKFNVPSETIPENNSLKSSLLDSIYESGVPAEKLTSSEKDLRKSTPVSEELENYKKSKDISVTTNPQEIVLKEACTDTHNSDELKLPVISDLIIKQETNVNNNTDKQKNS